MINFQKINYLFRVTRKAKIYKKNLYQAIPHFHKPHFIDIHDQYKYRTREQVLQQLGNLDIQVEVTKHIYTNLDPRGEVKNRKAIIEFDIKMLNFTHLQLERFKILMGPRFKQQTGKAKMACQMFPTYEQNMDKLTEQFKQVVLESKRAP